MRLCLNISCALALLSISLISSCDEKPQRLSSALINIPAPNLDLEKEAPKVPVMMFEETQHDFGTIAAGRRIVHLFKFKNTGDTPLLIASIHAPCGCTVAKEWPKEPISPGSNGEILIEFDSSDRVGHQNKEIDVISNAIPAVTKLTLVGDVIGPDYTPSDIK
jgi:hypothetical protein